MKNLSNTDFVIYDFANDHVISFENGKAVIYGDKLEAIQDAYINEKVISCLDLPLHWRLAILDQINEGL
jgi:hypothetical protein